MVTWLISVMARIILEPRAADLRFITMFCGSARALRSAPALKCLPSPLKNNDPGLLIIEKVSRDLLNFLHDFTVQRIHDFRSIQRNG